MCSFPCPILNTVGVAAGSLESHSVWKCASTWARLNGIAKDDKDHHGRWKNKRISDGHNDVQLDGVDSKVAAVLCPGDVCDCVIMHPACATDWIVANVTPNINAAFVPQLAFLFGKALLLLAHSAHSSAFPKAMLNSISNACSQVHSLPEGTNPIKKRLIAVTGRKAVVHLEDINLRGNPPLPPTKE